MFEVTDRGDVFVRARAYDWLINVCAFGASSRAYRRAVEQHLAGDEPSRVLDVGTGTGAMAITVKHAFPAAEVHGVDPSDEMLDAARLNGVRAGSVVHFSPGWAQDLPFADAEFDAVTLAAVLHHIPAEQRGAVLSEARRVLRPGGRALIVELVPAWPVALVVPRHRHRLDLDGCDRLLRATGFSDVTVGRVSPVLFACATGTVPATPPRAAPW